MCWILIVRSRRKRFIEDPKFDVFLNPTKRQKQNEIVKNLTKKFQKVYIAMLSWWEIIMMIMIVVLKSKIMVIKVFKSMDLVQSYPSLFQVLWYSINPCFDIRWNLVWITRHLTNTEQFHLRDLHSQLTSSWPSNGCSIQEKTVYMPFYL